MNSLQLRVFLKKFKTRGVKISVCAIDQLPEKLKRGRNYAFVTNLSKITDVGSHWIAMYIDKEGNGCYFDSYGFQPKSFQLLDFLKYNCKSVKYNCRQIQQLTSKVCGMYAACFIIHMVKGCEFTDFIRKFSKNCIINDNFIIKNFNYYTRN